MLYITQDGGVVWVHQCVLLPLCPWIADIVKEVACCHYPRVSLVLCKICPLMVNLASR